MKQVKSKGLLTNTIMLYLMSFSKMIIPLLTLPYLTRVLSVNVYGLTTYIKTCTSYIQLIIDFGFMLSVTREVVMFKNDKRKLSNICSETITARILLAVISSFLFNIFLLFNPLTRGHFLYTFLSCTAVSITCLLPDFLFRGLEIMHIITIRFTSTKIITTLLIFVFVKSDADILWIPILDIISNLCAVLLTFMYAKRINIKIKISNIRLAIKKIKVSFTYFLSDIATTIFGALNTVLIGLYISPREVAYWSVTYSLITAAQALYTPVTNGIYPHMVKNKNFNLIRLILTIFIPAIILTCILCYMFAPNIIAIISGPQYKDAASIFQLLLPVLIFSFPAMVLGWPALGAIGKIKETTFTTIISSIVHILGLFLLILFSKFTLVNIAILRCFTEFSLLCCRGYFCQIYKRDFNRKSLNRRKVC